MNKTSVCTCQTSYFHMKCVTRKKTALTKRFSLVLKCCDETKVATDVFLHIVMYIWVKRIIKKEKKCRVGYWFSPLVVDWIEADQLNVSLQSIVGKGWDLTGLNDWRNPAYQRKVCHFTRRPSYNILIKNDDVKKFVKKKKDGWINDRLHAFRK